MLMNQCQICLKPVKTEEFLCQTHKELYVLDKRINGYRLRKNKNGTKTRYTLKKYHRHEINLTKIIERFYGPKQVITGYRPLWATSKKGSLLEFDVAVPSKRILIEYNGEQHYEFISIFHRTKTRFIEQQRRDKRKARLAKKNNYTLVVFKFDEPLFEDYVIDKIQKTTVR